MDRLEDTLIVELEEVDAEDADIINDLTEKDFSMKLSKFFSDDLKERISNSMRRASKNVTEKYKDMFATSLANIRKSLIDYFNGIESYITSIESEEDGLSRATTFIIRELEEEEDLQKQISKVTQDEVYGVLANYFGTTGTLRYIREAFYRNGWDTETLKKVISATLNNFYPAEDNSTFIFCDEEDGEVSRLDFREKIAYLKLENGDVDEEIDAEVIDYISTNKEDVIQASIKALDNFLIPNGRLHKKLWGNKLKNEENNQITLFDYLDEKEKESVSVMLSVRTPLKDLKGVKGIENLTADEESWYDAIYSRCRAGNEYITTPMIYRDVMGNTSVKPTPKVIKEIEDFIEGATITRISIDNSQEAKLKGDKYQFKVTDNLLNMAKIEKIKINGNVVEKAWHINSVPILGAYAEKTNQIVWIDKKCLDTGTRAEYNPLKIYLLKEIGWYRHPNSKRSNKFLFETIYEETGVGDTRSQKKRCREQTIKMLDYWVEINHITSYKLEYTPGDNKKITPIAFTIKAPKYHTEHLSDSLELTEE